jgi:signal peptidase I
MKTPLTRKEALKLGGALALLATAWLWLAPAQLGGRAAYVVVYGISMEPGLVKGDLALLRQQGAYQVGDVVAYRHPQMGTVIHRIIAQDGGRYTLQGDNTTWTDDYQPTAGDVLGKMWLHVPKGGYVLAGFRSPPGAALLAGTVGALAMWPYLWPGGPLGYRRLTRREARRLAHRRRALEASLRKIPLMLVEQGELVASSGAISPAKSRQIARRLHAAMQQPGGGAAHGWAQLAGRKPGSGEPQQLVLFWVRVAGSVVLAAPWSERISRQMLRAGTLSAAKALKASLD